MTRVGWVFLTLVVLAGVAFVSTVRTGGPAALGPRRWLAARSIPAPAARSTRPDAPGPLAMPVAGVARDSLRDTWGDARGGGAREHHGTDIPAPGGTPVTAVAPGRVEKLFESTLGGRTLYQRSADGQWLYYYAHLAGYAPGVHEGQVVRPGDHLGFVGDTGDAGAGNFHLHFGVSRIAPGGHWWQGEDVDPFPLLAGRRARR